MSDFYRRALAANGDYGTLALDEPLTNELLAILMRDADLRTLDDWRETGTERKFEEFDFTTGEEVPRRLFVFAIDTSNEPPGRFARDCFRGESPAAARAKAAAWVREQKP